MRQGEVSVEDDVDLYNAGRMIPVKVIDNENLLH